MLEDSYKKEHLELLMVGESNWDYYLDKRTEGVHAIAKKESGASDCYFGSARHFKRFVLFQLERNQNLASCLTETGHLIIRG